MGDPTNWARILVLSGPSGSGKTTIVNELLGRAPVQLVKLVSATTRPPRQGEVDGVDYHFLSDEDFAAIRARDELLECAEVHSAGYWYGTLRSELTRAMRTGGWAFLEIDVNGALDVIEQYPDAITIFLQTPAEVYEQRLRARGTESEAVVQRRLETARAELQYADRYTHRVVNDELERAVEEVSDILKSREAELNA